VTEKDNSIRRKLLGSWGRWAAGHWGLTLLIAVAITAVMAVGAGSLRLEMTFHSLLPEGSKQVKELKKIEKLFPAASSIVVVIEAEQGNPVQAAERTVTRAVDVLTEELSTFVDSGPLVRVQGKLDRDFFKKHGLLLSEVRDIERMRRVFADLSLVPFLESLNEDFEREYSGNEEQLSEDEEMATSQFEGLDQLLATMEKAASGRPVPREEISVSLDRFLFGSPYFLSKDGTTALMFLQPDFTMDDIETYVDFVPRLDRRIKEKAAVLGVEAGLTGLLVVAKDEMVTSMQGLALSMTIAVVLILALMILTFRMYAVPLISGIPLLVGVFWTLGLAGFIMRRLNIMSAMYMVALVGLGIDYAIHLLTTYIQEREDEKGFLESIQEAMRKSGSGVLTGALTTAIAFFALLVAESQVVKELGVIAGLGILCELAAMFILVPALLGLRNRRLSRRGRSESKLLHSLGFRYRFMEGLGRRINRLPGLFAAVCLCLAVIFTLQAPKVAIEGNIMNMEAKGLESVELQDVMVEQFGMAPDLMSVLGSERERLRGMKDQIEDLASVKRVDSLFPYYPSEKEQIVRIPEIELFRSRLLAHETDPDVEVEALLDQMYRLEDNLLEMSDLAYLAGMEKMLNRLGRLTGRNEEAEKIAVSHLDGIVEQLEAEPEIAREGLIDFQQKLVPLLKETLLTMAGTERVTEEMLPKLILDSYRSEDGSEYLLNVVPTRNPWDQDYRTVLTGQLSTITDRATGMVLVADQMTQIARIDGVRAAVAALITIFLLLLIDFRNLKLSLITLFPLALSMGSLLGIMAITGIKFDFINIIAIPLLIGIGIDDAVHISHRYLLEGRDRMDLVVAKTGRAVLLTSLTTIIGFASFIPSIMRAMRSTGIVLSIAMALAFLFSILFYPSVLVIMAEKLNLSLDPFKRRRK